MFRHNSRQQAKISVALSQTIYKKYMLPKHPTIAIYGMGSFGYAILKHLDAKQDSNLTIKAYDRKRHLVDYLRTHRKHIALHQDAAISDRIEFISNSYDLVSQADILVLAISSDATRQVIQELKPALRDGLIILNTAKALDCDTGQRLSQVVAEELQGHHFDYALLSGGTIAHDLFRHQPLGVDLACLNQQVALQLKHIFESSNLCVYPTTDVVGVEYAGAFKNIAAILAGIVSGLGFSYGSETHLISRLAHDIGQVCVERYGASVGTFSIGSQSWGNDLWMSCTGNTRNRQLGILLGQGLSVKQALATFEGEHKTIEGVNTLITLKHLPEINAIHLVNMMYQLIVERSLTADQLKQYLLNTYSV